MTALMAGCGTNGTSASDTVVLQDTADQAGNQDGAAGDTEDVVGPGKPWGSVRTSLKEGWLIQSAKVVGEGASAAALQLDENGWMEVEIPSTVVGALVEAGEIPEFYAGMDIRDVPGVDYPPQKDFTNYEMLPGSPYSSGWWYRRWFEIEEGEAGQRVWLQFTGINHRADIYLNGELLADSTQVQGTFRHFQFDVTQQVKVGQPNLVAVLVRPSTFMDLAFTWVDWNPTPPDKNMGLWDEVVLSTTGPVQIRYPHVQTDLEVPGLERARLTAYAWLRNGGETPLSARLEVQLGETLCGTDVEIPAGQEVEVEIGPQQCPDLVRNKPQVWWPRPYSTQPMYTMKFSALVGGEVSDKEDVRFGIRKVESEFTPEGHRRFLVNGKPILIRGAGYAPDMMLRRWEWRDAAEVAYVKAMNLNAIRTEGKLGNDRLMDLCDENGILVIAGWCCCDHWEHQSLWGEEDHLVARESLRDQIRMLRNHPSLVAWFNASDGPPPADVEKMYLEVLEQERSPVPAVSSADDRPAEFSGPSGVKMTGPYEWVPPGYWTTNSDRGGAFGFNTETSPGPAIPPLESLRKFIPEEKLWPINDVWEFHTGGDPFDSLEVFNTALEQRYGAYETLEDYLWKADLAAYEGIRAMFEAFGGRKYVAAGVIQWMLNNAWPSLIWHLYDYYLKPAGGFFGAQKANEPVHVQWDYQKREVVVVNSWYLPVLDLKVEARSYNTQLQLLQQKSWTVDLAEDGVQVAGAFPTPEAEQLGPNGTWLLQLTLRDNEGEVRSRNTYWLPLVDDVLDEANAQWYVTPVTTFGSVADLDTLPAAQLDVTAFVVDEAAGVVQLDVGNPGNTLAFFVRVEVTDGPDGQEVVPLVYDDNYLFLWPGETATVQARLLGAPMPQALSWRVEGFNVPRTTGTVTPQR